MEREKTKIYCPICKKKNGDLWDYDFMEWEDHGLIDVKCSNCNYEFEVEFAHKVFIEDNRKIIEPFVKNR